MKLNKNYCTYFFLLLSLLLMSGNAFAVSQTQLTSATKKEASYTNTSSKQQFFEEVSEVTISSQQTEEPNYPFLLFYEGVDNYTIAQQLPSFSVASVPHRDVKKQLTQHLFPFHFFGERFIFMKP